MKRNAVDLFAGAGGWTTGAEQSGKLAVKWAANHWPDAVACHELNHPDTHHECQDLMQCDWRQMPDIQHGLLIASPACQGFSSNGRPGNHGKGAAIKHQADRNTAWAVLAACDTARPQTLVVENVVPFAEWQLFDSWAGTLRAMGYRLSITNENSLKAGVPQDRKRLIVVGELERNPKPFQLASEATCVADALQDDHGMPWMLIDTKRPGISQRMRKAQQAGGSLCMWANVDKARGRPLDGPAPTMTTRSGGQWYILDGDRCRMFSIRELARIQGFPDHYQLPTQRAVASKLLGNAVPPPMAKSILEQVA